MNYWLLLGIGVIVAGFALRKNPVLVVLCALVTTGICAQLSAVDMLAMIGAAFLKTRTLPLILFLPLAIIGLLERHGLKQQAQSLIQQVKSASVGRLLISYLAVREGSAALGLTSLGGHPQMVRPLLAPMAEALAQTRSAQPLSTAVRERVKALAAATDNVGLFFGEDIFVAFGAVMLMHTVLSEAGIVTTPMAIALAGIPTAIAAFIIHSSRIYHFDRRLRQGRLC